MPRSTAARPAPTPVASVIDERATWLIDQWIATHFETWAQALIEQDPGAECADHESQGQERQGKLEVTGAPDSVSGER